MRRAVSRIPVGVLDAILRGGTVAALKDLFDLARDRGNILRAIGLGVERAEELRPRVVLDQREGDDHGFTRNFRLPECGHALLEDADDGEVELADANILGDGVVRGKHERGKLGGQQANLAVRRHVVLVEVASAKNHEIANLLETLGDANEIDGTLDAADDHVHREIVGSRHLDHLGNAQLDGLDIGRGDLVGERGGLRSTGDKLAVDEVGADAFNLRDDVLLARQRHGDHQNDAAAPDDYAEHGERGAKLIRAERLQSEAPRFTPEDRLISEGWHAVYRDDFSSCSRRARACLRDGSSCSAARYCSAASARFPSASYKRPSHSRAEA